MRMGHLGYEAFGASLGETAPNADLGGSSNCSNESVADRRGACEQQLDTG